MEIIKGAVVVIYRDTPENAKEFLLLKHKNTFWTFAGGKVEDSDSSIEAGLKRELNEELGLKESDYQLFSTNVVNEFIYGDEKADRTGKKGITYYYLGKLNPNIAPTCQAEITELQWFTESEVLDHLAFADIKAKFTEVLSKL